MKVWARRTAGLFTTVAALSLFGVASAANAAESDEAWCAQAADWVAESQQLDTTAGIDFACTPGSVQVESNSDDEIVVVDSRSLTESSRSLASSFPTQPSGCLATTAPDRGTYDELGGYLKFCMIYGQNNSPVNGTWIVKNIVTLEVWLNAQYHNPKILFHGEYNPGWQYTTVSGFIHLKKENGGLPPTTLESEGWISNHFDTVPYWNFGNETYVSGVQSIHIDGIHVVDTLRTFEIDIQQPQLATWRFLCPPADAEDRQCRWPDGQEAPL